MTNPADELAIRSLAAAYTDAVNRHDSEGMAAVYAPDGELHAAHAGNPVVGIEKLRKAFRRLLENRESLTQLTHSGVVQIDGDRAEARWWFSEIKKPSGGPFEMVVGVYQDEMVRLPEGWRFAKRTVTGTLRWELPGAQSITTTDLPPFLALTGLPQGG